jgi:hypothetical protein
VRSTSVSGVGAKQVGFDSAAVTIMTECVSTPKARQSPRAEQKEGRTHG